MHEHQPPEATAPDGAEEPIASQGQIPDPNRDERAEATAARNEPQIWVGSWLDYNNGILHGRWLPAARPPDHVEAGIQRMLADSPTARRTGDVAEEWGVFDYDDFGVCRIEEQDSAERISIIASGIVQHGPAFAAWISIAESDYVEHFADAYLGEYDSVEAYAEELIQDLGYSDALDLNVPEGLRAYVSIDCDAFARDMVLGGDIVVCEQPDGGVWVFDGSGLR